MKKKCKRFFVNLKLTYFNKYLNRKSEFKASSVNQEQKMETDQVLLSASSVVSTKVFYVQQCAKEFWGQINPLPHRAFANRADPDQAHLKDTLIVIWI